MEAEIAFILSADLDDDVFRGCRPACCRNGETRHRIVLAVETGRSASSTPSRTTVPAGLFVISDRPLPAAGIDFVSHHGTRRGRCHGVPRLRSQTAWTWPLIALTIGPHRARQRISTATGRVCSPAPWVR